MRLSPRLDLVRHLAVYTAFHRAPANRLAHAVLVPAILFSAMCFPAYLGASPSHPLASLLHLATLLSLLLSAVLATVDVIGALVLLACLVAASALAGAIAGYLPWQAVLPAAIGGHLLSWGAIMILGHGRLEPGIAVGGALQDSNLYFRRRYHLARGLGRDVAGADVVVQFCISPLSVVQDLLVLAGLRRELDGAIRRERARVIERLGRDEAPLAGDG